jgi:hypothetical protein
MATVHKHFLINLIHQFQQLLLLLVLEQWYPLLHNTAQHIEYLQNTSSGCFGILTSINRRFALIPNPPGYC